MGPQPERRWSLRPRRIPAAGALLVGVVWVALSVAAAERLTRRSGPFEEPPPRVSFGAVVPLGLTALDGARVPAWAFDVDEAAPTVVLLHPSGGSRSGMVGVARLWAALGFNSLAVTLRAHGDAGGDRNDFGWSARLDALAALEWSAARRESPVILHGISLGAACACLAAPEIPAEHWARVGGIVLESPYTDLVSAVHARTSMRLPAGLDWIAAKGLQLAAPIYLPNGGRIAPLEGFASVPPGCPVLVLSGSRDLRAPPAQARAFRADAQGEVTLLEEDVGHVGWCVDAQRADGSLYREALRPWIAGLGLRERTVPD